MFFKDFVQQIENRSKKKKWGALGAPPLGAHMVTYREKKLRLCRNFFFSPLFGRGAQGPPPGTTYGNLPKTNIRSFAANFFFSPLFSLGPHGAPKRTCRRLPPSEGGPGAPLCPTGSHGAPNLPRGALTLTLPLLPSRRSH